MLDVDRLTTNFEEHYLNGIIKQTVDLLNFQARTKNVEIFYHGFIDDKQVQIDKMRCQQILINLLQNAIKFSNEGDSIKVSVNQFVLQENH